jgi:hypothetical protein
MSFDARMRPASARSKKYIRGAPMSEKQPKCQYGALLAPAYVAVKLPRFMQHSNVRSKKCREYL